MLKTWNEYFEATFYDEESVPEYTLPPLWEGKMDAFNWMNFRRPAIVELLKKEMYGEKLPMPEKLSFEVLSEKKDALDGLAVRKIVRVHSETKLGKHFFDILLYLPKDASAENPVPAFLGLNFKGNHACTPETDVVISKFGAEENRGVQVHRWHFAETVKRGYASATVCYQDITPDFPDRWQEGALALFEEGLENKKGALENYTCIGIWAWGLSRAMDYLTSCKEIDSDKVALHGHSRLGKTSLWAGALDTRFQIVISNDSGCCGAALARRKLGERVATIAHPGVPVGPNGEAGPNRWFVKSFQQYIDREETMPFDQHFLAALIAPRALAVGSATEDLWADPKGEYLTCVAATPAWELFGSPGIGTGEGDMLTGQGEILNDVSYHLRKGKHDQDVYDWEHYLKIADRFFKNK